MLFGLAPAGRASAINVQNTLQDTSRTSAGVGALWGRGRGLRHLLVVAELALCTMLLIGSGLLIRSFQRAKDVPPGFNPRNVLTLELTMSGPKYKDKQAVWNVYHELWQRLESLPGRDVGRSRDLLAAEPDVRVGTDHGRRPRAAGGREVHQRRHPHGQRRLLPGDGDSPARGPVLQRSRCSGESGRRHRRRHMAEQLWPGQDAVGKRFHIGGIDDTKAPWITIVGVVGQVKQYTLDSDSRIAFYLPHTQYPTRAMNVVVRSSTDPAALAGAVQRADSPDRQRSAALQRGHHGTPR